MPCVCLLLIMAIDPAVAGAEPSSPNDTANIIAPTLFFSTPPYTMAGSGQSQNTSEIQTPGAGIKCLRDFAGEHPNTVTTLDSFWHFDSAKFTQTYADKFRLWYANARFKDVSDNYAGANFRMGPIHQSIDVDELGRLTFTRKSTDEDAHTLIEVSVALDPERGNFPPYGGYRTMRLGVPYEFEMKVSVEGSNWWKDVPWAVVFQGHAIPDPPKGNFKFNPPFALVITRGRWQVHIRADNRPELPRDRKYQRFEKIDIAPVAENEILDLKVRVVWGFESESAAMSIWNNNLLVHAESEKANFFDTRTPAGETVGPYMTFGIYLPLESTRNETARVKFTELQFRGGEWPTAAGCITSTSPDPNPGM